MDRHGATLRRWAAIVLGVVALAARVATVLLTHHIKLVDDPADYNRLALSLVHGHGFGNSVLTASGGPTAFRPPLYPLFLAAAYLLSGSSILFARIVQAVAGLAAAVLVGVVATQLWSRRVGLIAFGIAAVYPPLWLVGGALVSESISLPLQMGAFAAVLATRRSGALGRSRWPWLVLAGILAGLLVLARPAQAVLLVPLALLVGPLGRSWRSWLGGVAVLGVTAVLVVVPWLVRDEQAFGRFVPVSTESGFILSGVYNDQAAHDPVHPALWRTPLAVPRDAPLFRDPHLDELALSDRLVSASEQYARRHLGYIVRVIGWNTRHLFDLAGIGSAHDAATPIGYGAVAADLWLSAYAIVALVAIGGIFTRAAWHTPFAIWLAPLLIVASSVVALGTSRYRAPVEPFLVLSAALACDAAYRQARSWRAGRASRRAIAIRV